nr:hypothetical protein [Tanacetum cinerariifolium]
MSSIPVNTTGATKLRKKSVIKQTGGDVKAKTLWKTARGVIANNIGFLVLVLFLAPIGRHIAKVEKILEAHADRKLKLGSEVSRKLESEVSGLKNELRKRVDDKSLEGLVNGNEMRLDGIPWFAKGLFNGNELLTGKWMDDESGKFNKRFREIGVKIRSLEGVLNGILTKEEFDTLVEKFMGWKGGEMGMDEIRAFAKGVVEVDYAVASGDASVKKHSKAYVGGSGACRVTEWLKGRSVRGDSVKVLQPSFGQPGECFSLKGESRFVELKIRIAIVPKTITLEHVVAKLKSKVF